MTVDIVDELNVSWVKPRPPTNGAAEPNLATAQGYAVPTPVLGVRLVRIADVTRERVEWCWLHRMPYGKLTVVEGDPGLGKSTLLLDVAARLTTGRPMPGTDLEHEPAGVVILTAEDGLGDTVRPRLEAAGADLTRVAALTAVMEGSVERMPLLPEDLAHVEQAAMDMRAALVFVDPLMAYLSADVNSHRDQDVRRALAPAAAMAERTGAAVVVIRHLNKSSGASALYRGGGSIGITGAARSVLLVAPDPEDEERCILAVSKSNLAPIPPALAYQLVSDPAFDCARVDWHGPTDHRAADLLSAPQTDETRGAMAEAADFLRDLLGSGPMTAADAERERRQAGISEATLRRARQALGVVSEREGGIGSAGRWVWRLEAKALIRRSTFGASTLDALAVEDPASAWDTSAIR